MSHLLTQTSTTTSTTTAASDLLTSIIDSAGLNSEMSNRYYKMPGEGKYGFKVKDGDVSTVFTPFYSVPGDFNITASIFSSEHGTGTPNNPSSAPTPTPSVDGAASLLPPDLQSIRVVGWRVPAVQHTSVSPEPSHSSSRPMYRKASSTNSLYSSTMLQ